MEENKMYGAAMEFVRAIKASAEYREYSMQLAKIQRQPELYDKVNDFREKNFVLQNTEETDDLMDRMEQLDREYEELRGIPLVEEFLEAETSFCRMMQEINVLVVKELDFQ